MNADDTAWVSDRCAAARRHVVRRPFAPAQPLARGLLIASAIATLLLGAPTATIAATAAGAAESIDQTLADFANKVGKEQESYQLAVEKAKTDTVKALEGIAHRAARAGDAPTQASAWKEALRLQRDHDEASKYFSTIGQLAAVLKELADADGDGASLGIGLAPVASPVIRTRRFAHAALVQQLWDTPYGGVVAVAATRTHELQFSGGGTMDTAGKIAILPLDLGPDWILKGDIIHLGTACAGFVFGFNAYAHTGALWYAEGENAGAVYTLDGTARTRIAEATLGCPVGTWLPFTVARKDNQVQISIAEKRYQVSLPAGHQGERFGLVTFYKETTIELANLVLTINPHEGPAH